MKKDLGYEMVPSAWGEVAVVWRAGRTGGEKIELILLPGGEADREGTLGRRFPGIVRQTATHLRSFCDDLGKALEGQAVRFSLELLSMTPCTAFEKRVLTACFQIPRGAVLSYGELAKRAGSPQGARAVGQVMAGNPFPIVIPCHRVVRGDGTLGGYGGGMTMKKSLLEKEGLRFKIGSIASGKKILS